MRRDKKKGLIKGHFQNFEQWLISKGFRLSGRQLPEINSNFTKWFLKSILNYMKLLPVKILFCKNKNIESRVKNNILSFREFKILYKIR